MSPSSDERGRVDVPPSETDPEVECPAGATEHLPPPHPIAGRNEHGVQFAVGHEQTSVVADDDVPDSADRARPGDSSTGDGSNRRRRAHTLLETAIPRAVGARGLAEGIDDDAGNGRRPTDRRARRHDPGASTDEDEDNDDERGTSGHAAVTSRDA